jgi:hypothetical protein
MYLHKTYSKICVGKYLCAAFPIQNNLNWAEALFPLLFIFASEYATKTDRRWENVDSNDLI